MAPTLIPYKDVKDITFNEFFSRMVQYATPLGEGWYRITDFRTTGYVLDRYPENDPSLSIHYGTENDENGQANGNIARTELEPIIVKVTQDEFGWNHHEERVYSEKYPTDEIYWKWDWGYQWSWQKNEMGWTDVPDRDLSFADDATLFGAAKAIFDTRWPLNTIEDTDPNSPGGIRVGPPVQDTNYADPRYNYFKWYRGFIYKRTCTVQNITASYDWRNVVLARYSTETDSIIWNGAQTYAIGQVVRGSDNWLYVSLLTNQNQDPTRYDAYNQPLAVDTNGVSLNPWWQGGTQIPSAPPTNAFAPMSMRRAWLKLWPYTFGWYSGWANEVVGKTRGGVRGSVFEIGRGDYNYPQGVSTSTKNILTQPISFRLIPDTIKYVRPFGPDGDSYTGNPLNSYLDVSNIFNVDLGGRCYTPDKTLKQADRSLLTNGDQFQESLIGIENEEAGDIDYASIVNLPTGVYRSSFVNDNRIVTFNPEFKAYSREQGAITDIRFGENSHSNTFFFMPFEIGTRLECQDALISLISQIQYGIGSAHNYSLPFTHLAYGAGWRYGPALAGPSELGIEPLEWPILITAENHGFDATYDNLHQVDIQNINGFSKVDFGSNFIGNVGFGAIRYYDGNIFPSNYYYIDNPYLALNTDGCFSEVTFKNDNYYNLFLHGAYKTNIDTSDGCVIEGVTKFNAKHLSRCFIRDVYSTNLEESFYTSIFHSIALNQSGLMAHSYLDNVVSSNIKNGFWYNTLSFMGLIPSGDLKTANDFAWFYSEQGEAGNNGTYYQRQGLDIGQHCMRNILKGNIFHTSFDDQFKRNNSTIDFGRFRPQPYTFVDWSLCTFGKGIARNSFMGYMRTAEFKDFSIVAWEQNYDRQSLLQNLGINKTVQRSGRYNSPLRDWLTSEPVIQWMSDDPMPMYWRWGDVNPSPSVPGSPYDSF